MSGLLTASVTPDTTVNPIMVEPHGAKQQSYDEAVVGGGSPARCASRGLEAAHDAGEQHHPESEETARPQVAEERVMGVRRPFVAREGLQIGPVVFGQMVLLRAVEQQRLQVCPR